MKTRFGLILLKNSGFMVCFRKFGPLKQLNLQRAVDHVSPIETTLRSRLLPS